MQDNAIWNIGTPIARSDHGDRRAADRGPCGSDCSNGSGFGVVKLDVVKLGNCKLGVVKLNIVQLGFVRLGFVKLDVDWRNIEEHSDCLFRRNNGNDVNIPDHRCGGGCLHGWRRHAAVRIVRGRQLLCDRARREPGRLLRKRLDAERRSEDRHDHALRQDNG